MEPNRQSVLPARPIHSLAERDVDLLLLEEFHVNHAFAAWFAAQSQLHASSFLGAWHSLSDQDGETDILLVVQVQEKSIGVLIENKIAAAAQPEQDLRYQIRGQRGQERGQYDQFTTVICAPSGYLDLVPESAAYEHRISYESIRDWFRTNDDVRSAWRAKRLQDAIEQANQGYALEVDQAVSDFHNTYWRLIRDGYPQLEMQRPSSKGSQSTVASFKPINSPKGVNIYHKLTKGEVDLSFAATSADALAAARSVEWPERVGIVQTGKSAVLRIKVPICDPNSPFEGQLDQVREAMQASVLLARMAGLRHKL